MKGKVSKKAERVYLVLMISLLSLESLARNINKGDLFDFCCSGGVNAFHSIDHYMKKKNAQRYIVHYVIH